MSDFKEFLVSVDKAEGEERAEYCVLSVNTVFLKERQAALVAAIAADGGVSHIAYSSGFRAEFYNTSLSVVGDQEDGESFFSQEEQDEFDGEHVAEVEEGTQDGILKDEEAEDGARDETASEDDRLLVSAIGIMVFTTLDDGATPVRSWTVTWDKLEMPYPKTG